MENLGLIIAIVGSGFGIIAVTVAMFLWLRTEANSDRRYFPKFRQMIGKKSFS